MPSEKELKEIFKVVALARELQEKLALDYNAKKLSPHSPALEILMRVVIAILEGDEVKGSYVSGKLETACGYLGYDLTPVSDKERATRLASAFVRVATM